MKPLSLLFIFTLLLLQAFSEAASPFTTVDEGNDVVALGNKDQYRPKFNCGYACSRRCRKASRKKMCLRACRSCCSRCHCVPPGTYGNKHLCPCYARLRTHGNRPKCP